MTPNFIFIGPSKSGSTWIYEYFKSHPDVFVPHVKDIYFFDKKYKKGLNWYKSFFPNHGAHAVGEICHDYMSNFEALKRIQNFNSNIKLICCLRNPIDRAWSSYMFFKRNGLVHDDFFSAAKDHPIILEEGFYSKHLKHLFSLFPKENILILDFHELVKCSNSFSKRLTDYLDLEHLFNEELNGKKINKASKPRSQILSKILKYLAVKLRNLGFLSLVGYIKRNELVLKIFYKELNKNELLIPAFTKKKLMDIYSNDINELSKLLNHDYSDWLK